jgi:hypothetical protein
VGVVAETEDSVEGFEGRVPEDSINRDGVAESEFQLSWGTVGGVVRGMVGDDGSKESKSVIGVCLVVGLSQTTGELDGLKGSVAIGSVEGGEISDAFRVVFEDVEVERKIAGVEAGAGVDEDADLENREKAKEESNGGEFVLDGDRHGASSSG